MKIFCVFIVLIFAALTEINCLRLSGEDKKEQISRLDPMGLENVIATDNPRDDLDIIKERALTEMKEGSFSICNLSDVIRKYRNWRHFLPRVVPFYALKTNDSPFILKVLASLGTGFDCASKIEIEKIIGMGIHPSRIIFAHPTKYEQHLSFAKLSNVKKMTFDGAEELYKIKKFFPDADLLLRIRVDVNESIRSIDAKYGCDTDIEGPALIRLASELGLNVVGIAFHVSYRVKDVLAFEKAIRAARELFDYASKLGLTLKVLDIGGGFPGEKDASLDKVSEIINSALATYFPSKDVIIMSEPARFFVASSCTLACRIHSKRKVLREGKIERIMYYLNDGVTGSFSQVVLEKRKMQPVPVNTYQGELYNSTFWGSTCASFDKIADNVFLPNMEINDLVVFENMGAYSNVLKTNFNNMPHPTIEYYIAKSDINYLDSLNIEFNF